MPHLKNWEPGIPRVQIGMFLDCDGDGKIDKPANDGTGQCVSLSSGGYTSPTCPTWTTTPTAGATPSRAD